MSYLVFTYNYTTEEKWLSLTNDPTPTCRCNGEVEVLVYSSDPVTRNFRSILHSFIVRVKCGTFLDRDNYYYAKPDDRCYYKWTCCFDFFTEFGAVPVPIFFKGEDRDEREYDRRDELRNLCEIIERTPYHCYQMDERARVDFRIIP